MNFVEITKDNWEEAIRLKPKRQQYRHLRGDVALHSLAKCYVFPGKYVPYIIEEDGKPIGCFRFRDYGRGVNLVAFFIDRKHQGRGLGRKAVEHFIEWVRQNYPEAREIELWVGPENSAARSLYESFGFFYTGEVGETGDLYMELHFDVPANESRKRQEQELFRSVVDYYSTPESLEFYCDRARNLGFYSVERAMVQRFM